MENIFMPSLHLTIWITNLNVLVQLAEEWISIGENVGPLELSRFFFYGKFNIHTWRKKVEYPVMKEDRESRTTCFFRFYKYENYGKHGI